MRTAQTVSAERRARVPSADKERPSAPRSRPIWALLVGGITLASLALLMVKLGRQGFWVDEASSWAIASQPWSGAWKLVTVQELNGSPYFLVLHLWLGFGMSEFAIRMLSVLFAAATVPVLYALTARLFGRAAGVMASLLLIVNAYFVRYGQEARQYTMALFFVTLSSYLFVRIVQDDEQRSALRSWGLVIGYAVASTVAIYAHFFSGLVIVAHAVSLVALKPKMVPWTRLLAGYGVLALLTAPALNFMMNNDRGQIDWLPKPSRRLLLGGFYAITGQGGPTPMYAYLAAGAVAVAAGAYLFVKKGRSVDAWGRVLMFLWFLVPILGSYAISFAKPIFYPRYLIVALSPLPVLAAVGLLRLRWRPLVLVLFVALGYVTSQQTVRWYDSNRKAQWREATSFVLENAQRRDGMIFFSPTGRRPFEYYAVLAGATDKAPAALFPPTPVGAYDADTFLDYMPATTNIPALGDTIGRQRRIWVMLSKAGRPRGEAVIRVVGAHCGKPFGVRFRGVRVLLFEACRARGRPAG